MADNHNQTNISPIWLQTLKSLHLEMLACVFDEEEWASLIRGTLTSHTAKALRLLFVSPFATGVVYICVPGIWK